MLIMVYKGDVQASFESTAYRLTAQWVERQGFTVVTKSLEHFVGQCCNQNKATPFLRTVLTEPVQRRVDICGGGCRAITFIMKISIINYLLNFSVMHELSA